MATGEARAEMVPPARMGLEPVQQNESRPLRVLQPPRTHGDRRAVDGHRVLHRVIGERLADPLVLRHVVRLVQHGCRP